MKNEPVCTDIFSSQLSVITWYNGKVTWTSFEFIISEEVLPSH